MIRRMERLRTWLTDNDRTQLEFAKAIGVSQPTVSDWLNGNTSPTTQNLREIAAYTGLSIDDLLGLPPVSNSTAVRATA